VQFAGTFWEILQRRATVCSPVAEKHAWFPTGCAIIIIAVPIDQCHEADQLVSVLEKLNSGQGPGFTLGGKVVSALLFWRTAMTVSVSVALASAFATSL